MVKLEYGNIDLTKLKTYVVGRQNFIETIKNSLMKLTMSIYLQRKFNM